MSKPMQSYWRIRNNDRPAAAIFFLCVCCQPAARQVDLFMRTNFRARYVCMIKKMSCQTMPFDWNVFCFQS